MSCPRCGARSASLSQSRYRPFCFERCRLFDLGDWATERYRVPTEEDKDAPESKEAD